MPSPFPGMAPYIEAPEIWGDCHGDLAAEIRAALNRVLKPCSVARLTPVNYRLSHEVYHDSQRKRRTLLRPRRIYWSWICCAAESALGG
jgi:hypothetical protein